MSVPIESPYATSYWRLILTSYLALFRSYCRLLFKFRMKNCHFSFLSLLLGSLGATYAVHLRLIGKRVGDFLFVFIELFSLDVTTEAKIRPL